ncbi:MAG: hypothetical protein NTU44_09770 [Bacteroidetes bacterium]|nr:hypothetical protein [Bacteroidota bacterium]
MKKIKKQNKKPFIKGRDAACCDKQDAAFFFCLSTAYPLRNAFREDLYNKAEAIIS